MTITELISTIKELSDKDKLLLMQVLVHELLRGEEFTEPLSLNLGQAEQAMSEGNALTLEERRSFLKKPLAERRHILAEQVATIHDHYQQDSDWQDLMAGDLVDY